MAKKSEKAVTEAVQAEEVSTAEVKEKKTPAATAKKAADAKSGTKTTKKTSKKESKAEEEKTAAADVILEAEETPQAAAENSADDMNARFEEKCKALLALARKRRTCWIIRKLLIHLQMLSSMLTRLRKYLISLRRIM